jgi:type VI protein secretion system component Hcp
MTLLALKGEVSINKMLKTTKLQKKRISNNNFEYLRYKLSELNFKEQKYLCCA